MKQLPYRALALDLDGTLLDSEGRVSSATQAVLRHLASGGLRILLASGRMSDRVKPYAQELGLPTGLVTYNGAVLLEGGPESWSSIGTWGLPAAARDAVFELCREQGIFLNVYAHGRLYGYQREGDYAWSRHYELNSGATYAAKHARLEDLPREGLEKLLVMAAPALRDRLYMEWSRLLAGQCDLTKSNPEYLEFLAKGVSKGSALRVWLARKGLDPSHLLAFGDAENDLEMLNLAGLGLAMSNATPGLRATYGRFTRWSHDEDGVARELCAVYGLDFSAFAA